MYILFLSVLILQNTFWTGSDRTDKETQAEISQLLLTISKRHFNWVRFIPGSFLKGSNFFFQEGDNK